MSVDRTVTFTGIEFENPFLLSSAPPTESESNILRAFEAGWGGVVSSLCSGPSATWFHDADDGSSVSLVPSMT